MLPLESWMTYPLFSEDTIQRLKPYNGQKIERLGVFLKDDIAWFENSDGNAYLIDKEKFIFRLNNLHAKELNKQQQDAILNTIKLVPAKFITKNLRNIAFHIECYRSSHNTYRNSRLFFNRVIQSK